MKTREALRLARMARGVPLGQLLARVWLTARRAGRVRLERLRPGALRPTADAAARPVSTWPAPLLPRTVGVDPSGPAAHFQGIRVPLPDPIDWKPPELEGDLHALTLHDQRWLEGADDALFSRVVGDWIANVAPYRPRYWLEGWNSFAVAIRVVVWMQELARRPGLDPGLVARAAASIGDQLAFLEHNLEVDIRGNHLVKDVLGLLWGAACFEGPSARRWAGVGGRLLDEVLDEQLLGDGLHFERSPPYHLQVTADLAQVWQVLPQGPRRDRLAAALERMLRAALLTTAPDGRPALLADGGLTMAHPVAALAAALGAPSAAPEGAFSLPDAGLYGARLGADHLLVDAGPLGPRALPAHGHADALSFVWAVAGRRLVEDTGVYEYKPGDKRARSRSTAAHNTVTLDGLDQAELFDSFRAASAWTPRVEAWQPRPDGFDLTATHDGYAHLPGRPLHRRRLELRGRLLRVDDELVGGRGQRAESRLLLHPDVAVELVPGGALLRVGDVTARLTTPAPVRVEDAPWWPDFGQERPTRQLVLALGEAPCRGGFVLDVR